MPSSRAAAAPPARSVAASAGRFDAPPAAAWRCRGTRAARPPGGPATLAPAVALGLLERGLERAVAAQDVRGALLADALGPGQPVRGVAAQRDEVGHAARAGSRSGARPRRGRSAPGPSSRGRPAAAPSPCSVAHWNRSRSPVRISASPPASSSARARAPSRSSASSSVVLAARPAEGLEEARRELPLVRAGRRASAGGGRGRRGRARRGRARRRGRSSRPPRARPPPRPTARIVFTEPSRAFTGRPSAPLIVSGRREERAVEQVRGVDEQERAGQAARLPTGCVSRRTALASAA